LNPDIQIEESPVIVNPDLFILMRQDEINRLRRKGTKIPLNLRHGFTAKRREILCAACFDGEHDCQAKACPCPCKHS
jgi:hypothetical protein